LSVIPLILKEATAEFDSQFRDDRRAMPVLRTCLEQIEALVLAVRPDAELDLYQRNVGEYWLSIATDQSIPHTVRQKISRRTLRLVERHCILLAVLDRIREQAEV
jgi:hypothetical protein